MSPDEETEKIIVYKCKQCGLTETKSKDSMSVPHHIIGKAFFGGAIVGPTKVIAITH
jgi:hypothetical protein